MSDLTDNPKSVLESPQSAETATPFAEPGTKSYKLLLGICALLLPVAGIILSVEYFTTDNARVRGPELLAVFNVCALLLVLGWLFRSKLPAIRIPQILILVFFVMVVGTTLNRGLEGISPILFVLLCILAIGAYGKRALIYCVPIGLALYTIALTGHALQLYPEPMMLSPSLAGTLSILFPTGVVICFTAKFVFDVASESQRLAAEDSLIREQLNIKNKELTEKLAQIESLQQKIVQCTACLKIQSLTGFGSWDSLQEFLQSDDSKNISHGICKTCREVHLGSDDDTRS